MEHLSSVDKVVNFLHEIVQEYRLAQAKAQVPEPIKTFYNKTKNYNLQFFKLWQLCFKFVNVQYLKDAGFCLNSEPFPLTFNKSRNKRSKVHSASATPPKRMSNRGNTKEDSNGYVVFKLNIHAQSIQSARLSLQSSELAPPPHPAASFDPPLVRGGGHTRLQERGREEPIRTKGQTTWHSRNSIISIRIYISWETSFCSRLQDR